MSDWTAIVDPPLPHPFPHSLHNDEWVLISGIVGITPEGEIPTDAEAQARLAVDNLEAALTRAGSGLHEIVYLKPYVADRAHVPAFNAVLAERLPDPKPASGALTVVGLVDARMLVELDAWAHRGARLHTSTDQ